MIGAVMGSLGGGLGVIDGRTDGLLAGGFPLKDM